MLFDSYLFLFLFLPIALLGYYLIGKLKNIRIAIIWLIIGSLFFYGYSSPIYLVLLIGSVLFNYAIGVKLATLASIKHRKLFMAFGVAVDILLLCYFKYANFFISNVNVLFNINFHLNTIIMPLAISFFTLTQIAYLVDIYRGETYEHGLWEYFLFVTFFPKLISGPIVRLNEMMPQITKDYRPCLSSANMAVGLTTIFLGLFKKVILADHLGANVNLIFDAASHGNGISFLNSWVGALSYAFQLYFDFSGYCDIAIGLGLIFCIRLPLNFYSPYKAKSIIDFWHRWHITFFRFIRDYIYIPLGGNRSGFLRQVAYLLVAMTIAGVWHGAGWTFIIWGALHGIYLVINHGWRRLRGARNYASGKSTWWGSAISTLVTFIAVTVAWVFFRADSVSTATEMLKGMMGLHGFHLPQRFANFGIIGQFLGPIGITFGDVPGFTLTAIIWILVSLSICWFLPNVQEYMSEYQPALDNFQVETKKPRFSCLRWKPSLSNVMIIACLAALAISGFSAVSKFIYFQF